MSNTTGTHDGNIFSVTVYSFITIVGLILNIIALMVFCSNSRSRSQTIVYMTNLAIADVLLILTLPIRIYYHLGNYIHPLLCSILGLVLKANMYSSIFLLMCICFDRCLAVTYPMSKRVQDGRKKAPLICFGIWFLTFGASVPIYVLRRSNKTDEGCFDSPPLIATQPVVVVPTLVIGFGVPLVLMLISSWFLVRAIRRSTVAQTDLVDSSKISKMIAVSLLIFFISFLPYHATLLVISLKIGKTTETMTNVYRYSLMMACFNTVLDPVAYYFTTDTFRSKVDMGAVWRMLPLNSHSSDLNRRCRPTEDS